MKRFAYIITISLILSLPYLSKAQIELKYTFDTFVSWQGSIFSEQNIYPTDCYVKTITIDNSLNMIFYNSDYSIRSNNTYTFTPPVGYAVNNITISKKIFNTDDNYEFMVAYKKINNTYDNTSRILILYNQNGSIIKDFGMAEYIYADPYLHIADVQLRLTVHKNFEDLTSQTDVYSVPGEVPVIITPVVLPSISHAYPNPSNTTITLPYSLRKGENSIMTIFNMYGQIVEQKNIDSNFDKILLNVSDYSKGTYIYEVNGISNKFVVE